MKVNHLENISTVKDLFEMVELEREIPPEEGSKAYFFFDKLRCRLCGDEVEGLCLSGRGWYTSEEKAVFTEMKNHIELHVVLGEIKDK